MYEKDIHGPRAHFTQCGVFFQTLSFVNSCLVRFIFFKNSTIISLKNMVISNKSKFEHLLLIYTLNIKNIKYSVGTKFLTQNMQSSGLFADSFQFSFRIIQKYYPYYYLSIFWEFYFPCKKRNTSILLL
mmetsp:Transcript_35342/g.81920  ORF Transcript_35342/g.81920 Transcript_35342/m.81920 type:complete len:129 (-) Transcript_35342:79-465(-)